MRGNAVSIVGKLPERMGTTFLTVKVFKNALWTALRTIFRPKCTRLQDFSYTISNLSGGAEGSRWLDLDSNFCGTGTLCTVPLFSEFDTGTVGR